MNHFPHILIVRTDRLGDVVLTTPAIKALKKSWPQARIAILVGASTRELLIDNPCLDEILVDDRQGRHAGIGGFFRLVLDLRQRKFDLAIIYHTKKRTNWLCFLAGIPRRIGYKNEKAGFLLTDPVRDERHLGHRHEAQYCLDLLRHLSIPPNLILEKSLQGLADDVYVAVSSDATKWLEAQCRTRHIQPHQRMIALHPQASDPAKEWPVEQFAELINRVVQRYPSVIVLIGSKRTAEISQFIARQVRVPIWDLRSQTTVGQLAVLLRRCQLLISNDSGPVHIAVGVGTPAISIFTRNYPGINPERWRPLGSTSQVVSVPQPITIQSVMESVDAVFKLC